MSDIGFGLHAETPKKVAAARILTLSRDDVVAALEDGWRDFKAAPAISLSFGLFYALGGWMIFALATMTGLYYLAYPFATGFALLAPFTAAGLYEVSRRLERGEPVTWQAVIASIRAAAGRDLGWMALVLTFALIIWVDLAAFLYVSFFGIHIPTLDEMVHSVLGTPSGVVFLIIGNAVGGVIAFAIFSVTVIACPMLMDRDVDFVTAMTTSVAAVRANPGQMFAWAAMVALWFGVAVATLLAGLVVILPVLGHATWHLYRRAIAPLG